MTNVQNAQSASTLTRFDQIYTDKESSDWKAFSGMQDPDLGSFFMESPLSTGGPFYTPLNDRHLNPFKGSFLSAQSSVPFNYYSESNHPDSAVGYQNDCGNESTGSAMVTPPFVNLSNIAIDDSFADGIDEENKSGMSQFRGPIPSPSERQPVRSSPRRGSAVFIPTPIREHHKRTKSESHARIHRSNSVPSPDSSKPSGARANHNMVEKQYRTRLNGQFENLLKSLPNEAGEKRVSKAEVLILAKERIEELEVDKKELEAERTELQMSFQGLKERWVKLGGLCMP